MNKGALIEKKPDREGENGSLALEQKALDPSFSSPSVDMSGHETAPLTADTHDSVLSVLDERELSIVTHRVLLEEIIRCGNVPSWMSYWSQRASDLWRNLCCDAGGAATYESSINILRAIQGYLYNALIEEDGRIKAILHGVQFVSLGVGDGVKDQIILDGLAKNGIRKIDTILVDSSRYMLADLMTELGKKQPVNQIPRNRSSVTGKNMLFEHLTHVHIERTHPGQSRIVALIGLTVGNFPQAGEGNIFEVLQSVTEKGDLLLIDYQTINGTGSEEIRKGYDVPRYKEFVIQPLRDIIKTRFPNDLPKDFDISWLSPASVRVIFDPNIQQENLTGGDGIVRFILSDEACAAFESFVHIYCNMPDFILPRPFDIHRSCKYMPGAFENKLQQNGFSLSEHKISGPYGYNLLMARRI